jgi:hypothetical protein
MRCGRYTDPDGDSCEFYAQSLDPPSACSHPGYEAALVRCPVACGSCAQVNRSSSSSLYGRFFTEYPSQMTLCGDRNNLGSKIITPTPVTVAGCARACFSYIVDGKVGCKSFMLGRVTSEVKTVVGTGPTATTITSRKTETTCEFSSRCDNPMLLTSDAAHLRAVGHLQVASATAASFSTYMLRPYTSDCDPVPGSPLRPDECGKCGGANRSCHATFELLVSDRPELLQPRLGTILAASKWEYTYEIGFPARVCCVHMCVTESSQ